MKIFDSLRALRHPQGGQAIPAQPDPVSDPQPDPVSGPSVDSLVAAQDWEALTRLGPEGRDALVAELRRLAALDPLPRRLADRAASDPHQTFGLIRTLVDSGDPKVPALLAELLEGFDDNADPLRGTLFEGLALTGTELAASVLVDRALHDSRLCVASGNSAAFALAAHPCPGAVPALVEHLADPDPEVRTRAVSLLGAIPDDAVTPALLRLLSDPDESLRTVAIQALAAHGDAAAVPGLLTAEERDRRTRRRGHSAAAYDGAPSPALVAVDDILGGIEASSARRLAGQDSQAVEQGILERTAEVRRRYVDTVADALAGIPEGPATTPTVSELSAVLAGPECDIAAPGVLRLRDRSRLDLTLSRCSALGCSVGEEAAGESSPDPQGGESWWIQVPVTCADGLLTVTVLANYTPLY